MTIQRRTLLLSALAAFAAPAIVRAESLMKIKPVEIWTFSKFQVGDIIVKPDYMSVCIEVGEIGSIWRISKESLLTGTRYHRVEGFDEPVYREVKSYYLREIS